LQRVGVESVEVWRGDIRRSARTAARGSLAKAVGVNGAPAKGWVREARFGMGGNVLHAPVDVA